jgi:flagellar biogenesis protein FliO
VQSIPFKPADDLFGMLLPVAIVLLVLAAAAVLAVLYFRRAGLPLAGPRQARRLRLVERVVLSRRASLLLVECDGRKLLLGESGDRLSLLDRGTDSPP